MNEDKLKSFIKFVKKDITSNPVLFSEFEPFMDWEQPIEDAEEYFISKGMVYDVQRQPSDVEICKVLMRIFLYDDMCKEMQGDVSQYVIGKAIKHFRGTVNPKRVKEISEELTR